MIYTQPKSTANIWIRDAGKLEVHAQRHALLQKKRVHDQTLEVDHISGCQLPAN
jgi:hypothetical protein